MRPLNLKAVSSCPNDFSTSLLTCPLPQTQYGVARVSNINSILLSNTMNYWFSSTCFLLKGMFPGPVAGTDSLNDFTSSHFTCPCYQVSPPQPHHAPQGIKRKQTRYGDLKGLVNSLSISMSVRGALIGTLWGKASVPGGREVAPTPRIPAGCQGRSDAAAV